MSEVKVKSRKAYTVKVVTPEEQKNFISARDIAMDERATRAVKVAVEKAKFCEKPVAKYDLKEKKAYIEYANGVKKYVD